MFVSNIKIHSFLNVRARTLKAIATFRELEMQEMFYYQIDGINAFIFQKSFTFFMLHSAVVGSISRRLERRAASGRMVSHLRRRSKIHLSCKKSDKHICLWSNSAIGQGFNLTFDWVLNRFNPQTHDILYDTLWDRLKFKWSRI